MGNALRERAVPDDSRRCHLDGGCQLRERSCRFSRAKRASVVKAVPSRAFEGFFGAVKQARFHEVIGQSVLRLFALFLAQVGASQQMLVHTNGALVFARRRNRLPKAKWRSEVSGSC